MEENSRLKIIVCPLFGCASDSVGNEFTPYFSNFPVSILILLREWVFTIYQQIGEHEPIIDYYRDFLDKISAFLRFIFKPLWFIRNFLDFSTVLFKVRLFRFSVQKTQKFKSCQKIKLINFCFLHAETACNSNEPRSTKTRIDSDRVSSMWNSGTAAAVCDRDWDLIDMKFYAISLLLETKISLIRK